MWPQVFHFLSAISILHSKNVNGEMSRDCTKRLAPGLLRVKTIYIKELIPKSLVKRYIANLISMALGVGRYTQSPTDIINTIIPLIWEYRWYIRTWWLIHSHNQKIIILIYLGFTGIDSPYEPPLEPECFVKSGVDSISQCVAKVIKVLENKEIIPASMTVPVKELFVAPADKAAKAAEADKLPKLELTKLDMQWFQILSEGWATPLKGFMREDEFLQCLHFNCIFDQGTHNQSIPIVLPLSTEDKERLSGSEAITLTYNGVNYGIMRNPEFYGHRKEERCARTWGVYTKNHPHIKMIYEQGDWLAGGEIECIERVRWNDGLDKYRKTPLELRARFEELGADAVFVFQLRNPVHNGHALLMTDTAKKLKERGYKKPVLLLHPLGNIFLITTICIIYFLFFKVVGQRPMMFHSIGVLNSMMPFWTKKFWIQTQLLLLFGHHQCHTLVQQRYVIRYTKFPYKCNFVGTMAC